MRVLMNSKQFKKDLDNLMKYSIGFLEGVQRGKQVFLSSVGSQAIEVLKEYIDSNARVDPAALHHVYEWMQTGSPQARLFDISYTISNLGLSVKSTFRQSSSIKAGSTVPFYDKARIMEDGVPVRIEPKRSQVLSFTDDAGQQVFTSGPVDVENPGGQQVQGAYQKTFDSFFNLYFKQSFLKASGIMNYLEKPQLFKRNFAAGRTGGKQKGMSTGYRWIINAGLGGL